MLGIQYFNLEESFILLCLCVISFHCVWSVNIYWYWGCSIKSKREFFKYLLFLLFLGKIPFIHVGNQVVSELGPIVQFTKAKVRNINPSLLKNMSWYILFNILFGTVCVFLENYWINHSLINLLLISYFYFLGPLSERRPGRRAESWDEGVHGAGQQHAAYCWGTDMHQHSVEQNITQAPECPHVELLLTCL